MNTTLPEKESIIQNSFDAVKVILQQRLKAELEQSSSWMNSLLQQCNLNLTINKATVIALKAGRNLLSLANLTPIPDHNPMSEEEAELRRYTCMFDERRREKTEEMRKLEREKELDAIKSSISKNNTLREFHERLAQGEKIYYTHGNSKRSLLAFIPVFENDKAFASWTVRKGGLQECIAHMDGKKVISLTEEPASAELVCRFVAKTYPNSFRKVAINNNFSPVIRRLTNIETAALAKDIGIADKTLFDKLGRHLKVVNNGSPLLCTLSDFNKLTEGAPPVEIEKGHIMRSKKKEQYTIARINLIEQMRIQMSRELESGTYLNKTYNTFDRPLFGYRTSMHNQGVYYMDGMDYGNNAIQFTGRLNYGSPFTRRMMNNPDFQTMDFQYGVVKCPKERHEIIAKLNGDVKKHVDYLRKARMIAVENARGNVHCLFVDKRAKSIELKQGKVFVSMPTHGRKSTLPPIVELPSEFLTQGKLKWYCVISHFQVLQIGDLCAQLTLQGRKGMSGHCCMKCIFNSRQWKALGRAGKNLKRRDLRLREDNAVGQTEHRYWPYSPSECIVPLLHCEIGTAKVQIFDHLIPFLLRLDRIPKEEQDKMKVMEQLQDELKTKEDSLHKAADELMLKKQSSMMEKKIISHELSKAKGRLRTAEKSKLDNSSQRISTHQNTIKELRNDLARIEEDLDEVKEVVDKAEDDLTNCNSKIFTIKKELQMMLSERSKNEGTLYSFLETEMRKHNVYVQAYHGGSLTGGDVIQFFNHADQIIQNLRETCREAILQLIADGTSEGLPSVSDMDSYLDSHKEMFAIQNSVYANLRIIHPTKLELKKTRVSIKAMKILWHQMGFSETHKAHLIFYHAAEDQERWGGLGDKTEDAIERLHQSQKMLDYVTMRMRGGHGVQLRRQAVMRYRDTDPRVRRRLDEVYDTTARKFTAENRKQKGRDNRKRARDCERTNKFKRACTRMLISLDDE